MNKLFEIELFGLPKINLNANSTWQMRYGEMKKWKRLVYEAVVLGNARPQAPLRKAKLVLTRYAFGREPDRDNLRASFKHVVDGLVESQVIIDDCPEVIGEPEVHWAKAKPKHGKIKIEVYEVSA